MIRKQRVLIVDDEPQTLKFIGANLRARGYHVLTAEDGRTALKAFAENVVDLVVLDLMLPGMDGFQVCQALRRHSATPIMILSARGRETDIVTALDLGADDYLTKPFGVEELLARLRAVLRRLDRATITPCPPFTINDLQIDFATQQVTLCGNLVSLTSTEYNLLAHLAQNAGRVLTHRTLLQSVWGPEYGGETEYLWAYIRRLRRKLELDPNHPRYILTQPGVGYMLCCSAIKPGSGLSGSVD